MTKRKLTETTIRKYKLIIDEWFVTKPNNFNGKQAYLKFYPRVKAETATTNFSKISVIPVISKYIQEKFKVAAETGQMTHKDIVKELEAFALLDIRDVLTYTNVRKSGFRKVPDHNHKPKKDEPQKVIDEEFFYYEKEITIKDFEELTPVQGRAIKSLKYGKHGIEIDFFDKARAFEMLNKHKGFYQVDNEQKSAVINISTYNEKHRGIVQDILDAKI
jgi:phage terminase small subunit